MDINVENIVDMGQLSKLVYKSFEGDLQKNEEFSGNFLLAGTEFSLQGSYTIIDFTDTLTGM